ncbi:MAG: hypothetical protein HOG45_00670 [Deltaproteobacteria bacterium]|nr:hypothetical protein [Deltaproteobacteria bacterium]
MYSNWLVIVITDQVRDIKTTLSVSPADVAYSIFMILQLGAVHTAVVAPVAKKRSVIQRTFMSLNRNKWV